MTYRPLVAASQPLFDDECPQRDSRRMRRMPVVHKLLRVRSLHRVPGNQARQFDPVIFRIQFPERKNKVLECQLSLLLVHPPSLLCKLLVGSSRFSLHLYDTIRAVHMLVFLCFGGCGADSIYVSKELARDLAKDSFQVTAYTRLNTDAISSTAILDFAGKAIQNTGIVEEQVMLTEYSAVMSGVITSGIPIPVPLLAALTAILAATIVYGVFYTKIVKNVQMFGQLRTVGMTKRQIKRMASKEGRLYALAGIPLGLVIGVLIGFIGCPDGFRLKTTVIYAVLIAAVAFVTVNIAIFKPVRVAMNTSPVEGAKYLAYAGKAKSSSKLHRKLTPFNLAKINIQRNKQKAVLTLLMLGVSGALLLVTSTVAGSIDPAKQASFKYYPAGNILIQIRNTVGSSFDNEAEPYGSAKLQLEENPLEDQALMQELEKVDGIEKITAFDSVYMTATFSGGSGSITSISDFFPTLNREQTEEKQAVLSSGTADYDDMVEKNGILVAEDIAQVGDTLKIEGRAFDGRTFDVEA